MKVTLPLSLKVTLWLILNLFLLGAAAMVFLVLQGGLSWDALVAGAAGDRLHALANVISAETAAAAPADRNTVLERFGRAYHADLLLIQNHGPQIAGTPTELPSAVRQRIDEGPPTDGFRPHGLGPPEPGFGAPAPAEQRSPDPGRPGPKGRPAPPGPRGRFLVHTSSPTEWWIGLRVPYADERPAPPRAATLVIRARSFWSVVLLLNLESWFLVGASVLVLSILFWLPLVRSITHHLRVLMAATERIADGHFDARVPTDRRDELGRLGESVNAMAARLDTLVNGQKRFLADVAHELGSPLARLQVGIDILESRTDAAVRAQIADVREEVEHMTELVNELLTFTKAGMRPKSAELGSVLLDEIFGKVIGREDVNSRVQRHGAAQLRVRADEPLLSRAIGNLIRNAIRYSGDASTITLAAQRDNGSVVITIEDDGPGVPAAALARLGEPFYRPEFARTRETGGTGLGLAIVRSSVAACGGEVRFSNRTPHGFRAQIRLNPA